MQYWNVSSQPQLHHLIIAVAKPLNRFKTQKLHMDIPLNSDLVQGFTQL